MHGVTSIETKSEERNAAITTVNHTSQSEPSLYSGISSGQTDIQSSTTTDAEHQISKTPRTRQPHVGSAPATEVVAAKPLLVSSKDFTGCFTPPDYLIDGLAQRRFIYSLTGNTGTGKTAIALRIAAHVALGEPIGDHEVEKGRVLYFAGENPDDLRMRWIALSEQMPFDRKAIDVHFIVGAEIEISKIRGRIDEEVEALGGVALVIVDTSAAYFNCDDCKDENDNVQARNHAAMFRSLTLLNDGPTVLVLAHPPKNAKHDNLLPRGGGAFLNEVDGNFTVRKGDGLTEVHWQGKFRGPEFDPIWFELPTVGAIDLKDSKGRAIRTVIALPVSDEDRAAIEATQDQDAEAIRALMASTPNLSLMDMARALRWTNAKDQPDKRRIQKGMDRLKRGGLVSIDTTTKRFKLTKKGLANTVPVTQ